MCSLLNLVVIINIIQYGIAFNIDTDFPIIYFDVNENSKVNKSYFGFSVILYEGDNTTNPWIQIGAPRGHDPLRYNFFQPGLVYRCHIGKPCGLFFVDNKINAPSNVIIGKNPYQYIPKKDKAWVGATMDIDTDHKRIVVCAPRWINTKRDYYIQGACYWSNVHDAGTKELLPLVNLNFEVKDDVYLFPMGQAGMSVHFPKTKTSQLVMGAPGVYNWKGTVISYEDDLFLAANVNRLAQDKALYKFLTIPDASRIKDVFSFGYLGYSISSGNFFSPNELSYVAGAPRSATYKGQIIIFNFAGEDIITRQTRQGEIMGEYFGASIGVADINGDHLDDLIVGAPHYTTKNDEGRIYIYYGSRRKTLIKPDQSPVITGNYSGGQFGTAIQSLGDIDDDGCADIAVGAPYEDEEHGVVYIYNGRRKGNPLRLTQRIEGKRLYSNLQGFGISFSRPTDIDGNYFKDIAIGSFLSDNAVILRTRPSVVLDMSVQSLVARLDRKSTKFDIQVCLIYSGRNLPPTLTISRKVILDKNLHRAFRFGHTVTEFTEQIVVRHKMLTCNNITIGIKTLRNNDWEPIEIIVTQELTQKEFKHSPVLITSKVETKDGFCKDCPIANKLKSTREVKIDVPYALNCGSDNKCDADLVVSGNFIGLTKDQFVIGLQKTLALQISVLNKKEPAYLPEVELTLPENVYLSAIPPECDEKNFNHTVVVTCFLDNPLEENAMKKLTIQLDMEAIINTKHKTISFNITTTSKSDDINPKDNSIIKKLFLTSDASIQIIGKTEKSNYHFGYDNFVNTTHIYEIQKSGVSPLNEFTLNVSIPVSYKKDNTEIHFMAIHKPRGFQDRQSLTCYWPEEYILDAEVLEVESRNMTKKKRSVSEDNKNNTFISIDKAVFINCSVPEVTCKSITCTVGPFRQTLKGASIQIKMVMNVTQIRRILGDKEGIYLSTDGKVAEIDGHLMDTVRITNGFKRMEEEKVSTWIIIVAIISGVLILLLIILGLIKAGFFERKQKAELEALKQAEDKTNPNKPTNLCFLDWQLSHVGSPVLDIFYFTYACTDKKLRDEHFHQLLKDYYQTLTDFTKELGTDLEKHYSFEILQEQLKKFGKYALAIGIMLLHLLLSDADEIPDFNELCDGDDMEKMIEAFDFESKNVAAYNSRMRDVILHLVENKYI